MTIERDFEQFKNLGWVSAGGVIAREVTAQARQAMEEQLGRALEDSNPRNLQVSRGSGHYQLQPRLEGVLAKPEFLLPDWAKQRLSLLLGADFKVAYINSNVAGPGSSFQDIHRDHDGILGIPSGIPVVSLVVMNVLLDVCDAETGSTEVFPSSHLFGDDALALDPQLGCYPPTRINGLPGGVVLRNLRLWHRGTPNLSQHRRWMLSIVFRAAWHSWRHHRSVNNVDQAGWPTSLVDRFAVD